MSLPVPSSLTKEKTAGFATFPNQVHVESVETGFELNVMVVGESGLGKSTFINALFMSDVYVDAEYSPAGTRPLTTLSIQRTSMYLEEKGVRLRLTLVDTPGFGAAINNNNTWSLITEDVDRSFEQYLDEEARIHRSTILDNRIHACLYFVAPTGRGLKPLDICFLKQLHHKVNIIPIIGRADALTDAECQSMKEQVLADIEAHGIDIFKFSPDEDEGEQETAVPFCVSASSVSLGKNGRGRVYPWGTLETDNAAHSDFTRLRNLLLRTRTQELIDHTCQVHYERFRTMKLSEVTAGTEADNEESFLTKIEQEKELHMKKLSKMEAEMSQVFALKVREKEQKLKDREAMLLCQNEDMRQSLIQMQRELESKRVELSREKTEALQLRERTLSIKKDKKTFI